MVHRQIRHRMHLQIETHSVHYDFLPLLSDGPPVHTKRGLVSPIEKNPTEALEWLQFREKGALYPWDATGRVPCTMCFMFEAVIIAGQVSVISLKKNERSRPDSFGFVALPDKNPSVRRRLLQRKQ